MTTRIRDVEGPSDAELNKMGTLLDRFLQDEAGASPVAVAADQSFVLTALQRHEELKAKAMLMLLTPNFSLPLDFLDDTRRDYKETLVDWKNTIVSLEGSDVSEITMDNLKRLRAQLMSRNEELEMCLSLGDALESQAREIYLLLVQMQRLRDDWDAELENGEVNMVNEVRDGVEELCVGGFYELPEGHESIVDPDGGEWGDHY